jgi:O-methyltransferase involved in polyketide biosynthesis
LWARAKDAEKKYPILNDTHAKAILERIDYDFGKLETRYLENHQLVWSIRACNFENCVRDFLLHNRNAALST